MAKKLYEIFNGDELKVAEKIQRRRLQMLVHSYLYYQKNVNIISDYTWGVWAQELKNLQNKYPNISKQVPWNYAFEGWDGSTGAFLPLDNTWVVSTGEKLYVEHNKVKPRISSKPKTPRRLF